MKIEEIRGKRTFVIVNFDTSTYIATFKRNSFGNIFDGSFTEDCRFGEFY